MSDMVIFRVAIASFFSFQERQIKVSSELDLPLLQVNNNHKSFSDPNTVKFRQSNSSVSVIIFRNYCK